MKTNLNGECLNKLQYNHPLEYYVDIEYHNFIKHFISLENAYELLSLKVGNIIISFLGN